MKNCGKCKLQIKEKEINRDTIYEYKEMNIFGIKKKRSIKTYYSNIEICPRCNSSNTITKEYIMEWDNDQYIKKQCGDCTYEISDKKKLNYCDD